MTKEEYIAFLNYERNMSPTVRKTFVQFIEEHFELVERHQKLLKMWGMEHPKPYTLEDLKEDMWVWDDKEQVCYQIGIDEDTKEWVYYCFGDGLFDTQFAYPLEFEENRFYPVQKANEGV